MFFAKSLIGSAIYAEDGPIGKVEDIYFDDETWAARYLIVNTAPLLPGGKVLLTPFSVMKVSQEMGTIYVDLTKEQVKLSPDIDEKQPISIQMQENQLLRVPMYANNNALGPINVAGHISLLDRPQTEKDVEPRSEEEAHLRSVKEIIGIVTGYSMEVADNQFGRIDDLVIEEGSWIIRYFVADMKKFLPSKMVLLSTSWIQNISWDEKYILVDLEEEQVKNCPEFSKGVEITRNYEDMLFDYYQKPKYWLGL